MYRDVPVTVLARTVIEELVRRTPLPSEAIEDVILGQGYPNGEAPALGRVAALDAGLGIEVPGMQVDRRCGAGLQAIMLGCMKVQTGAADLVLAGGAESMSQAEARFRSSPSAPTPVRVRRSPAGQRPGSSPSMSTSGRGGRLAVWTARVSRPALCAA